MYNIHTAAYFAEHVYINHTSECASLHVQTVNSSKFKRATRKDFIGGRYADGSGAE